MQLPAPEDPGGKGLLRPNRRYLYGILTVLIVVAVVRFVVVARGTDTHASLARSCTTAAFAIRGSAFDPGGTIALALTGPAQDTYAIYVDVAAVGPVDGKVVATPVAGREASATTVVAPQTLPSCFGQDTVELASNVDAGAHELDLFRVGADGTETFLQRVDFTVR